jgi:hypothetical protein
MATAKRKGNTPRPMLSVAAFCTKVLEGRDGLMSGIRFFDQITVPVSADRDPESREPISLWALIGFKAESFEGEHVLRLVMQAPTGKRKEIGRMTMRHPRHVTSINHRIQLALKIKSEGLFWVDVILDGKRYTRMPLRVSFAVENKA